MIQANSLPVALLHELLSLDVATGTLTWKARSSERFVYTAGRTAQHAAANWNSRYAGTPALSAPHVNGYLCGQLLGVRLLAHRAIWAMHFGHWPVDGLDHINGIKTDNRPANLRPADHIENARNMRLRSTSRTGVTGVTYDSTRGKYYASIQAQGKTLSLGRFDHVDDAKAARRAAEIKHGFHPNHGRNSNAAHHT